MNTGSSGGTSRAMAFPRFLRLPTEIQWNVWSMFCPELTFRPFLFEFSFDGDSNKVTHRSPVVSCTATVRTVLAVHWNSRQLAIKALPDTLAFGGGFNLVRFRKERDMVMLSLDVHDERQLENPRFRVIPGFSESVVNLVMSYDYETFDKTHLKFYCCFPNLRVVYERDAFEEKTFKEVAWCQSDLVHRAWHHDEWETYCWPNLVNQPDYARKNIRAAPFPAGVDVLTWALWSGFGGLEKCLCSFTKQDVDHLGKIKVWPTIHTTSLDLDGSFK